MEEIRKPGTGAVKIWSLKEKCSGMTFVNPNILALKYRRDMKTPGLHYLKMWVSSRQNHAIHWGNSRPFNVIFVLR